jgi:lysophospholipase L1-like esterase
MRWSPPKVVGLLVRGAIPGLRRVHAQVAVYAKAWDEANQLALAATGPLWVVLGDSTAQGIGAPSPDEGYVGQVHRMLEATSGQAWRVLNLSKSGGRVSDVLATQLPRLEALDVAPDLVTCAIGSNDIIRRTPLPLVEHDLREIIGRLPPGSVVATLPAGLWRERVDAIDAVIRSAAAAGGLRVADVGARTGPPWEGKYAEDRFHPGALGYADWAAAFAETLGLTDGNPS